MIAALSAWHEDHDSASAALAEVDVLPAHVALEAYSVLTRLPAGLAVEPEPAAAILRERFHRPPLSLGARARRQLVRTLAVAGVRGGATYDGLIALEARAHDQALLTLDARAELTYRRLGVVFTPIPRTT